MLMARIGSAVAVSRFRRDRIDANSSRCACRSGRLGCRHRNRFHERFDEKALLVGKSEPRERLLWVLVEQLAERRPVVKADDFFLNVQVGIGAAATASDRGGRGWAAH